MDILGNLFGGDRRQEDEYRDFLNRYDQGPPYAGISGREAYNRYEQVAGRIPPDVYEESARDALDRLSPQERGQFAQMLRQQSSQGRSQGFPGFGAGDNQFQDAGFLSQMLGQMQRQQPGMMSQMLGGRNQYGGGGLGDLMDNPVAKAALAGIAAMAVKKMMSR